MVDADVCGESAATTTEFASYAVIRSCLYTVALLARVRFKRSHVSASPFRRCFSRAHIKMNHLLGSETKPVPEQPSVHSTDSLLSAIPTMSEQQHPHGASQCQSLSAAAGEQQPPTAVPASGSASPPAQSPSRTRKASNADLVLSDVRPSKRQRGEGKHQDTVPPGVMGLNQSVPPRSDRTSGTLNSEATSRNRTRDPNVSNSNSNVNEIYGSGTVNNNNNNNNVYVDARPPAHPPPYKRYRFRLSL